MMINSIEKDFTGRLTMWGINCSFAFSIGFLLAIRPVESETETFVNKCRTFKGNFDSLDWVYGKSFADLDYAFHPSAEQGPACFFRGTLMLVIDIVLQATNAKNPDGEYLFDYIDLQGFTAIDFTGKAVDAVFLPKAVLVKTPGRNRKIEWMHYDDYSKAFDTEVEGTPCKLVFSTFVDRDDFDLETNSLGAIHSIIRLIFPERQDLSMIEHCWEAVCAFLAFCVGQLNVTTLSVGLWDQKNPDKLDLFGNIDCIINSDKVDDIQSIYPTTYRFPVSILGEKVGQLFQLLNDKTRKPVLGFLRKTNSDIAVDRNKIRELCTACETEFDYRKEELSDSEINALVNALRTTVKQYKIDHPDAIAKDEYGYISSSISAISKPARKKILCIHKKYKDFVDSHFAGFTMFTPNDHPNVSDKQTEEDIGWLTKTRNSITHSAGVIDTEIPNYIFARLKVSVLCSILERASYSLEEIREIIDQYFSGIIF